MAGKDLRLALTGLLVRWAALPATASPQQLRQLTEETSRLLADRRLPFALRRTAAARLLRLVPDRLGVVRRLTTALTQDLRPRQQLACLRWLQQQVIRCEALDQIVHRWEQQPRWRCPLCRQRFSRAEFARHLWKVHQCLLERGRVQPWPQWIKSWRLRYAREGDPQWLDRAWVLGGTAALRYWLARSRPTESELQPLLQAAAAQGAGLCPECLGAVPAAVPPLPRPLTVTRRRLGGDGFFVEQHNGGWIRRLWIGRPDCPPLLLRDELAPRAVAALMAGVVLLLIALPSRTILAVLAGCIGAGLAYAVLRWHLRDPADPHDLLLDIAWQHLASTCRWDEPRQIHWLTRLILTSFGSGNRQLRRPLLRQLIHLVEPVTAIPTPDESGRQQQILAAAAEALSLFDQMVDGRDVVPELIGRFRRVMQGKGSWIYAEALAAAVCQQQVWPAEQVLRLQREVLATAFAYGWTPWELLRVGQALPHLGRWLVPEPPAVLEDLYAAWRGVAGCPASGRPVFAVASRQPELLLERPDLLWVDDTLMGPGRGLGPILIGSRGVSIGGVVCSDPDAEIRRVRWGRGLWFGGYYLQAARTLPRELPDRLRQWLRFWADWQMTAEVVPETPSQLSSLASLVRRCPTCGARVLVARGRLGHLFEDTNADPHGV